MGSKQHRKLRLMRISQRTSQSKKIQTAQQDAAKAPPELVNHFFRVDDRLGSFEQSRRLERNEERKMMEAAVQGDSQATTVAVALQNTMAAGSTPAPVFGGGAAET